MIHSMMVEYRHVSSSDHPQFRHTETITTMGKANKTKIGCFAAFVVVTAILAYGIYQFLYPSPQVFASSNSPDGRLECVIIYYPPGGFMASPHLYDLIIRDSKSGKELPGASGYAGYDSVNMPPVTFEWNASGITVWEDHWGRNVWVCKLADGIQRWEHREKTAAEIKRDE
jgi:hypothetical protein